ncbi:polysaccharide deacetylase family protein [Paucibacter sp. R3-3]|uniref:Polysaccharide deacetylase family protein n=1 Tax=Roseateles agri TaxID=3098619 RepID=A0ABU5DRC6_9BURK|nr:polysaccharide deacetylase family protein [Paucibacter sp. R3-3]MDY0747809.1 polysaccharide deacetylase family protein [Paucibacter sp. R3-3]
MLLRRSLLALGAALASACVLAQPCDKPVYLTFDTGHMGVAPLIAETLKKFDAKATFFLANEPTLTGGMTLDSTWAPWWKERAAEGHDFGAHTWNHDIWLEDIPDAEGKVTRFKVRTVAGMNEPVVHEVTAEEYCESLKKVGARFQEMTGRPLDPIFRAPAGRASKALLAVAQRCGFHHVGWSAAGFLGDELPSDKYPNSQLLEKALKNIKPGDILLAHLGIWSRQDAWAPAVLEPLMQGLKERGMCFAPLHENPRYAPLMSPAKAGGGNGAGNGGSSKPAAKSARQR